MGCINSSGARAVKTPVADVVTKRLSLKKKNSRELITLGSAILIQSWYRRCKARLEARRRCAWMIYQSLEYADEHIYLKLSNLFNDLIVNAVASEESIDDLQKSEGGDLENEEIWLGDWVPPLSQSYQGPRVTMPLDLRQAMQLMETFSNKTQLTVRQEEIDQDKSILLSTIQRLHAMYVFQILTEARSVLKKRANIQVISTSISKQITVVGDLHGQLSDLRTIFFKNGLPDVTNPYIFNGDLVDRGRKSVETLITILAFMLVSPSTVYINRGNHEDYYVNRHYGFIREIQKKYKSVAGPLVKLFSDFYRYLPLATVINNTVFVCHGGVATGTDVKVLEHLDRFSVYTLSTRAPEDSKQLKELYQVQALLWSDPQAADGCQGNRVRGIGYQFGPDITSTFLERNKYTLLIRSHECRVEGFEWTHNRQVLTVFSASNYYSPGSNKGAYVKIDENGGIKPIQFLVGRSRSMRMSVCATEQSAVHDLKQKIFCHSGELRKRFIEVDTENTGLVTSTQWCQIMEDVLELKLPWHMLQPRIVTLSKKNGLIQYESTFERMNVSCGLYNSSTSVMEELYKNRDVLQGIFRAIDKDDSGYISVNEFKTTCLRLPSSLTLDEVTLEEMARSIDLNQDGKIDFNEFIESFRLTEVERERQEENF